MMFEELLEKKLEEGTGVTLYPVGVAGEKETPFVVFMKNDDKEIVTMAGGTGLHDATIGLVLAANDYDGLKALEAAVRETVKTMDGVTEDGVEVMLAECRTGNSRSGGTGEWLEPNSLYRAAEMSVTAMWRETNNG